MLRCPLARSYYTSNHFLLLLLALLAFSLPFCLGVETCVCCNPMSTLRFEIFRFAFGPVLIKDRFCSDGAKRGCTITRRAAVKHFHFTSVNS
uniref:Putative secreted peptide n=1 Tax=Anopheles braziliensis TaxID=58242 RepID=A0A2M3ZTL8_9DIPT